MQDVDISKAKQYLVHLSKAYGDVRKKAEKHGYNMENTNGIGNSKRGNDLDFGLHELETRLFMAMKEESNILEKHEEEDHKTTKIKEKMRVIEDKLDQFLRISHAKRIINSHVKDYNKNGTPQKNKIKNNKENKTAPHERIALMKKALEKMKKELKKVKKGNVDHEQTQRISKRISLLHDKLNVLEKDTKN